jgi:uncharacterized Tic20 family protein
MDLPHLESPDQITREERTSAMLAHILTIFAGFIAPTIIYVVKRRESRFVAFHALQAALWHLLLFVVFFVGFVAAAVVMFSTVGFPSPATPPPARGAPPPLGFFLGFFGLWLVMMLVWASNVGFCIYLAVRANEGKWTRYPLVGSLAMRLLGLRS